MAEFPILTKAQATFIKSLSKSNIRREHHRVLVEGVKCCNEVINSECKVDYLVVNANVSNNIHTYNRLIEEILTKANQKDIKIFQTKNSIFETLCDAQSPQNIIAIAEPKSNTIINNQSFILLDNVADPGNVGTIIRTADWFGIKQVLFFGNCADKYSPKVIRSSMGSVFRMNLKNVVDISIFQKYFNNIPIYAASLDGNVNITDIKKSKSFGLIVGNESRGISSFLNNVITQSFYINGSGTAESLNVAIATGISLFHLTKN